MITGEGSLHPQTLERKTQSAWRDWHESSESQSSQLLAVRLKVKTRKIFDGIYQNVRPGMSAERKHETRSRTSARERARTGRDIWRRAVTAMVAVKRRLNASFLCVPRIVRGIHIINLPRSDAMKLNYRISFRPSCVFHSSGPVTEGPCRKFFCAIAIKCVSCREIKST